MKNNFLNFSCNVYFFVLGMNEIQAGRVSGKSQNRVMAAVEEPGEMQYKFTLKNSRRGE